MEFTVGQHVCHPTHGLGEIKEISEQTIHDTPQKYYVIKLVGAEMTTYIPVGTADRVGLRPVISQKQTEQVLSILQDAPQTLPDDHKQRQSWLKNQIFSGQPIQIAQAIRALSWHKSSKGKLNTSDKQLLEQGKELLATEVAIARNTEEVSALSLIDNALWSALDEKQELTAA